MQVSKDVKKQVMEKIDECMAIARKTWPHVTFDDPTVSYDLRGTTAGRAYDAKWLIKLNAVLLMENVDEMVNDTVPHELAHLLDGKLHPETRNSRVSVTRTGQVRRTKRSLHGPTWKSIMRVLGVNPERTHSMDTTRARVRQTTRYPYICKCCTSEVLMGPKQHKRAQQGILYTHRGCGRAGILVSKENWQARLPEAAQAYKPSKKKVAIKRRAQQNRPTKKTSRPKAPRAGSKLEKCRAIMKEDPQASREALINRFCTEGQCTPGGAATYYAKLKKELS